MGWKESEAHSKGLKKEVSNWRSTSGGKKRDYGSWIVLPTKAVWIPPGVAHDIKASGYVAMKTL